MRKTIASALRKLLAVGARLADWLDPPPPTPQGGGGPGSTDD